MGGYAVSSFNDGRFKMWLPEMYRYTQTAARGMSMSVTGALIIVLCPVIIVAALLATLCDGSV